MAKKPTSLVLSWEHSDIERQLGFQGCRNTGVSMVLSFSIGLLMALAFYMALYPMLGRYYVATVFYERGPTQYTTVLFTCWVLAFLFFKWRKLVFQRRALAFQVVPMDVGFTLTPETAPLVLERLYAAVDNPKHFMLFARIELALANLKNLRRVADLDEVLRSQAENEENSMESSYTNIKGFIWAIPVLGFIGTVLGLSGAFREFRVLMEGSSDMNQIKDGLKGVTMGLSVAFETTMVSLASALVLQMLVNLVKKGEEDFLDECKDYSLRHIVTKLRAAEHEKEDGGVDKGGKGAADGAKAQEG